MSAQLSLWVEIRFTQIKKESVKETKPTFALVAARLEFSMCFANFIALQNKSIVLPNVHFILVHWKSLKYPVTHLQNQIKFLGLVSIPTMLDKSLHLQL
jgi:hypothetical protein